MTEDLRNTYSLMNGGASHYNDMNPLFESDVITYTKNGQQIDALPGDFFSSRSYADFLMNSIRENRGDGKPFFSLSVFRCSPRSYACPRALA